MFHLNSMVQFEIYPREIWRIPPGLLGKKLQKICRTNRSGDTFGFQEQTEDLSNVVIIISIIIYLSFHYIPPCIYIYSIYTIIYVYIYI